MSALCSSRCVFVAITAVGLLASCVTYPEPVPGAKLEPPQLQVYGLALPPEGARDPLPLAVEIRNGAGDVLYSGPVGRITERMPLSKLDGTLVFSTRWTNGTTTTQTLKSAPGTPVEIAYDPLQQLPQQRYVLKTPEKPLMGATAGLGAPSEPPTRVTITDGTGKRLFDGSSELLGLSGTDVPSNADGKLNITMRWPDGSSTTQGLGYRGGQVNYDSWEGVDYVDVAWDPKARQYRIDAPQEERILKAVKRALEFRAGYGKLNDEPPTFGVTVGEDTPLKKASGKIDYYSTELKVPFEKKWQDEWTPELSLKAFWGDKSTQSESSVGSRGEAFQGGFSNGSGGFASVAPSISRVKTSYNEQLIGLSARSPWGVFNQSEDSRISKEAFLNLSRLSRKYDSTLQYPAIPALTGNDDQQVTTWNLGGGLAAVGHHFFDNGVRGSIGGRLNANYVWGDYSGDHRYTAPAGLNQDFTQSTSDSKNVFTWGGGAFGELGYRPNRNTEWSVRFDYGFLMNGLALQNKVTPSDPNPYLISGSLHSWRGTLGVRSSW